MTDATSTREQLIKRGIDPAKIAACPVGAA